MGNIFNILLCYMHSNICTFCHIIYIYLGLKSSGLIKIAHLNACIVAAMKPEKIMYQTKYFIMVVCADLS